MQWLDTFPLVSDQITKAELQHIISAAEAVLQQNIAGDFVELGCYEGATSLFLQRLLVAHDDTRKLHVYDSFAGLPAKTTEDESPIGLSFVPGELRASKRTLIRHFKHAHLPLPIIHKAWFDELRAQDMPRRIALAFLDGDFYASITASLALVWPHLTRGAMVIVDDYQSEALPGAKRAVDEWLRAHPARLNIAASLAIMRIEQELPLKVPA
jgi:O-methyltransferase